MYLLWKCGASLLEGEMIDAWVGNVRFSIDGDYVKIQAFNQDKTNIDHLIVVPLSEFKSMIDRLINGGVNEKEKEG
jgi:hypothetical protein